MGAYRNKKKDVLGTFGKGSGAFFRDEILDVPAYRVLTPTERLLLRDMMRVYLQKSNHDKKDISDSGLHYTWADCKETVDKETFYRGRKRILATGWFQLAPNLKDLRPAAPDVFLASQNWRKYEPTGIEQENIHKKKTAKLKILADDRERRAKYRQSVPKSR